MPTATITISIRLPVPLYEALERLSQAKGMTVSAIVRDAVSALVPVDTAASD